MSFVTKCCSSAGWFCALSVSLWHACACAQFVPTNPYSPVSPPPVAAQPVAATSVTAPIAAPPLAAPVIPALPEPIYWKQNLFLIPYQWSSAADPSAAQSVWLLVSRDRGASWQKISEARPQVKAFNYNAEGDGEYWFAIRTIDRTGQPQPPEAYHPELRVIVDTSMPRFESLCAQFRGDGTLQIQTRASDANLDATSWKFEVQLDGSDTWQPLAGIAITPDGQAAWQPPAGARPRALRATVYDRAGNSAAFGAAIANTQIGNGAADPPASATLSAAPRGWVSASDIPSATSQAVDSAAPQAWPAGAVARSPFRLSDGAAPAPGDQITSYGNPTGVGTPLVVSNTLANDNANPRYASEQPSAPSVTPLEPYRETSQTFHHASLTRLPTIDGAAAPPIMTAPATTPSADTAPSPTQMTRQLPPGADAKHVGSRTFALEYDLEDSGRVGISKVELWGTRDGGQSWRLFAIDSDHRSPLVTTVDEAGLYGFRIVVESAGGSPAVPPGPGVAPELWVDVDLSQPTVELTSVRLGTGNLADHLILSWRADDDNLNPRPISLFFSSRPAGPWTAIAANLNNTGQYAWQIQRYLPDRFYLRLEARDVAGNVAAFQTREPVVLPTSPPTAELRDVQPVSPTAGNPVLGVH